MAEETEFQFDDECAVEKKESGFFGTLGQFIWNPKNKEFLGRDGSSWGDSILLLV